MKQDRKEKGNFPNLRFPEFEEEWEKQKLGEIVDKVNSGKTPLGGEAVYTKEGVLFIRSQNVNNDKLELENSVFIPESVNSQMKNSIVQPNDILLNITGASLGRSCVVPNDFKRGNVNQHVCIIRLKKQYSPRFIQPLFSSNKGQTIFTNLQTGSGREGLTFESIKSINISVPILEEQQKIASFLCLINERIETQNKIIKKYESLIKGISEKLFNQKLKFKNGDINFPSWDTKKVKDVLEAIPTKKYQINSSEICSRGKYTVVDQGKEMVSGYCNNENNVFKDYPVIIFGDHTTALKYIDFEFIVGADGTKILKNKRGYILKYLYYNLCFNNVKQDGYKRHFSILSKTQMQLPSADEQIIIASFLSGIDKKIKIEKEILNQYERQKTYLLYNLFT